MNFIERLDLGRAEPGLDDISRFLLKNWEHNQGLETPHIARAAKHLVIMSGICIGDLAPSILMTGRQSLTYQVLDLDNFRQETVDEVIGDEYRRFVASSYKDAAINSEPVLDLVSAEIAKKGTNERIVYERLILPYKTRTGIPHLICYSMALEYLNRPGFTGE